MKKIPLSHGAFAIVDDADYPMVCTHKWHLVMGHKTSYAARNMRVNGRYKTALMHRIINKTPVGMETDHRDGNGLNNRRYNLRNATRIQNARNRSPNANGTSPYKGVYWDKQKRKWRSSIRVNKKLLHVGLFIQESEAADAYRAAASKHFGNFNWTSP